MRNSKKYLCALQWCWPFNQPVDTNQYKDYLDMVKTPMDFSTVKKRIEAGGWLRGSSFLVLGIQGFTRMGEVGRL